MFCIIANTTCSAPALKRVFLFSCLTALRLSGIKKHTWEEIQPYGSDWVMCVVNQNHFLLIFLFSIRIVCADGLPPQLSQLPIDVSSETSIKNIVPLIASDIVAETTIDPIYLNKDGCCYLIYLISFPCIFNSVPSIYSIATSVIISFLAVEL